MTTTSHGVHPADATHKDNPHTAVPVHLRIRLHAANLPRHGRFLRSTPPSTYAVVTSVASPPLGASGRHPGDSSGLQSHARGLPQAVVWGRTETIHRSCHPQWTQCFAIDHVPGTERFFYVHIFRHTQTDDMGESHEEEEAPTRQEAPTITVHQNHNQSPRHRRAASSFDYSKSLGSALFEVSNILAAPSSRTTSSSCGTPTATEHTRVKRLRHGGCLFCRLEQYLPGDRPQTLTLRHQALTLRLAATQLRLPRTLQRRLRRRQRLGFRQKPQLLPLMLELAKRPAGGHYSSPMWIVTHRSNVMLAGTWENGDEDNNNNDNDDELQPGRRTHGDADERRHTGGGRWSVVWEEEPLDLRTICSGDLSQPILITIKSVGMASTSSSSLKDAGNMRVIGMTETTLEQLLRMGQAAGTAMRMPSAPVDDMGVPAHANGWQTSESLSAAVTGEASREQETVEDVEDPSDSFATDDGSSSDEEEYATPGRLEEQSSCQDGNQAFLRPNELLLQRSLMKYKHVGRLRVLKAELLPVGSDGTDFAVTPTTTTTNSHSQVWGGDMVETVDLASLSPNDPDNRRHVDPSKFQHYLEQGLELDFCVAIDFTSSNGDPRLEGSHHYQDPNGALNDYEETIVALGTAIEAYSVTKAYRVWGFGAKFGGLVRHLFQLGASTVLGVDGILAAYRSVFSSDLIMSGPTILVEVMQKAAIQAKAYQEHESPNKLRYNVLLIITDGLADAFEETQRKVAVYSQVPLSIVIVGVGSSSGFERMYKLMATAKGCRRNVSFVEFDKFQHHPGALGVAALRDIPIQVCEYFAMRGL